MLFNEIYGVYYSTVARILEAAVDGELTEDSLNKTVADNAFPESVLYMLPSLTDSEWQLLDEKLHTPLKNHPSMPLTLLEKRWLKAISMDPRFRLFGVRYEWDEDVEPMFTEEDYLVFDKYSNGDPFDDKIYIRNFRSIMTAITRKVPIRLAYKSRHNKRMVITALPEKLEYSEKDDKFRMLGRGKYGSVMLNLGRIRSVTFCDGLEPMAASAERRKDYLELELVNRRNALDRVMMHFAHFEKEAERIDKYRYRIRIFYDKDDETELVIRVLSFGPFIRVTGPDDLVVLIRKRLEMQKICGLK